MIFWGNYGKLLTFLVYMQRRGFVSQISVRIDFPGFVLSDISLIILHFHFTSQSFFYLTYNS